MSWCWHDVWTSFAHWEGFCLPNYLGNHSYSIRLTKLTYMYNVFYLNRYSKCPKTSNTLVHTVWPKFCLLSSCFLKYLVEWETVNTLGRHLLYYLNNFLISQLAFYVNLHRAVIGPSATLTGRWRPDIDLRRMLTEIVMQDFLTAGPNLYSRQILMNVRYITRSKQQSSLVDL